MSDVVEKTLASLPKFLGGSLLGVVAPPSPKRGTSRGFHNFLRIVNKAKSKQEEEILVRNEIKEMEQTFSNSGNVKYQTCDSLCKAMYCAMLGYDLSSLSIHAVTLAQQGKGAEKRLGYLASSLLLNPHDDLTLLLINTIQKDLQSTNMLDNCTALTVVGHLISTEHVPSILPLVVKKLQHSRELVRMKAAACINYFLNILPPLTSDLQDEFRQILFDKDPGVMSMGVHISDFLIKIDSARYPDIADSLVNILRQIVHKKLPQQFEFHNTPMPWLQINILKTLAQLGSQSKITSEKIYPVLHEVLERVNLRERISYAIVYECIMTISAIHPSIVLLKEATTCTGKFLHSPNKTLQYIGIRCLTSLVHNYPEGTEEYQLIVVDLLDDTDEALQQKTLEFLYKMANASNVQVICDRLLNQVSKQQHNMFLQTELVTMVIGLANKFKTDGQWYVETIFKLLGWCQNKLKEDFVNTTINVIATFFQGNDHTGTINFKQFLIRKALETLKLNSSSDDLLQLSLWIFGEFAPMLNKLPEDKIISLVLQPLEKSPVGASNIHLWVTSALMKMACAGIFKSAQSCKLMKEHLTKATDVSFKQNLNIVIKIVESDHKLSVPLLGSENKQAIKLTMDFTFSFLDDYVTNALDNGAKPYLPKLMRHYTNTTQTGAEEIPLLVGNRTKTTSNTSYESAMGSKVMKSGSTASSSHRSEENEKILNLKGKKKVWGKEGRIDEDGKHGSSLEQTFQAESDLDLTYDKKKSSEINRKENLAKALFGNLTTTKSQIEKESVSQTASWGWGSDSTPSEDILSSSQDEGNTLSTITDKGGWRNLHTQHTEEPKDQNQYSDHMDGNLFSEDLRNNLFSSPNNTVMDTKNVSCPNTCISTTHLHDEEGKLDLETTTGTLYENEDYDDENNFGDKMNEYLEEMSIGQKDNTAEKLLSNLVANEQSNKLKSHNYDTAIQSLYDEYEFDES